METLVLKARLMGFYAPLRWNPSESAPVRKTHQSLSAHSHSFHNHSFTIIVLAFTTFLLPLQQINTSFLTFHPKLR